MNSVLIVFLSLSLSGSILALILLALRPLIKNRLSQTWQYYIWLLVILRFLLPFTPQVSVVGEAVRLMQSIGNTPVIVDTQSSFDGNEQEEIPLMQTQQNIENEVITPNDTLQQSETPVQSIYLRDIMNNIWLLWIAVALVLFVHKVASYRSFVRFVKVGMEKITDAHIMDIYFDELAAAKVKRRLPIYINNQVISPMLVGIIRPELVIPILEASDNELRNILRHELTHYKRLDFLYKWIVQITLCLHWFNPLVYLISKQINKSCELSCDESVIKHLDEDGRITYGDALMTSLKAQGNYSNFVVSMTMSENVNIVKERLDNIMDYRKTSKHMACVTAFLTVLLLCGFTFTGAYAANNVKPNATPIAATNDIKLDDKAENKNMAEVSEYEPYLPFGITVSSDINDKDVLYHNGQRIRLFVDQRADNSFNLFFTDAEGVVDISVTRNTQNIVTGVEKMSEQKAKEFSDNFMDNRAYPVRLSMSELPIVLQEWIEQCNQSKGIFVTQFNYRFYVYCNSIPGEYVWEPSIGSTSTLELFDSSKSRKGDGYALLSIPLCDKLTVTYNENSISVTKDNMPKVSGAKHMLAEEQQSTIDKSTIYKTENGKVTVPFSIANITQSTEGTSNEHYGYVCLGQIPNIKDAKRIIYNVNANSGSGLFVAMSIDDKSVTHQYDWYNFSVTPNNSINKIIEGSKGKIGGDFSYSGNYYLYVGTTETMLSNITGTITIEY